jgi:hypothetical protein
MLKMMTIRSWSGLALATTVALTSAACMKQQGNTSTDSSLPNGSTSIRSGNSLLAAMLTVSGHPLDAAQSNPANAGPNTTQANQILPQLPMASAPSNFTTGSSYPAAALAAAVTGNWTNLELATNGTTAVTPPSGSIFAAGGINLAKQTVTPANAAAVYNALALKAYGRVGLPAELAALEQLRQAFMGTAAQNPTAACTGTCITNSVNFFRAMLVGVLSSPLFLTSN